MDHTMLKDLSAKLVDDIAGAMMRNMELVMISEADPSQIEAYADVAVIAATQVAAGWTAAANLTDEPEVIAMRIASTVYRSVEASVRKINASGHRKPR